MDTNPTPDAPLRDVAQNADASAKYLANVQRHLLELDATLEILQRETRVHCRAARVEGDRWGEARWRARPVEAALRDVRNHLAGVTEGLEKAAHKRSAHAEKVAALPAARQEKKLEKARKKGVPVLQAVPEVKQQPVEQPTTKIPTSIEDLRREWSA